MISFPIIDMIVDYFKSQTIIYWMWILSISITFFIAIRYWDLRVAIFGFMLWIIGGIPVAWYEKRHGKQIGKRK